MALPAPSQPYARPATIGPRTGRRLLPALKAAVTAVVIVWLLWRIDLRDVLRAIAGAHVGFLALCLGLYVVAWLAATWKWRALVRPFYRQARFGELLRDNLAGALYSLVLPGQVSGELVKAGRLAMRCGRPAESALSVALDRLAGFAALAGLGGLALVSERERLLRGLFQLDLAQSEVLALLALVAAAGATALAIAMHPRGRAAAARLGSRARALLGAYGAQPRSLFQAGLGAILFQALVTVASHLLLRSLGFNVPLPAVAAILAVTYTVQFLPLSAGGFGVREGSFVVLLGFYGVPASAALAFSLLTVVITVLIAVAGSAAEALLAVRTVAPAAVQREPGARGILERTRVPRDDPRSC